MKTSHVFASLFFGSLAAAAPVDKRANLTKTEVITETVVTYATIYGEEPVPQPTAPAAAHYEAAEEPSSTAVKPTTTPAPAYTPPVENKPSSIHTPSVEQKPSSTYTPPVVQKSSSIYTPPVVVTPTPTPTPTPTQAEQVSSTPVPATTSAAPLLNVGIGPYGLSVTGELFSGDFTIYDNNGGYGSCGTQIYDTDMVVALAQPAWGASTYDTMTGDATNPWCGQKIQIEYNGKTCEATIMDMCPGCTGHDIDLSLAVWHALGMEEKTRIKGTWSKIN